VSDAATLLLVRHGRTAWNRSGRWHGQADVPLDELGVRQAQGLAPQIARLCPDRVVTSPLIRARRTAQTLAMALGHDVELGSDDRLKEVDVGTWEGLVDAEVAALDPEFPGSPAADRRFSETGERPSECAARVAAALRDLARSHPGQTVLVVSHAYAIKVGVGALLGWDLPATNALAAPYNCAYAELRGRADGPWSLVSWNVEDPHVPLQRLGEVHVV